MEYPGRHVLICLNGGLYKLLIKSRCNYPYARPFALHHLKCSMLNIDIAARWRTYLDTEAQQLTVPAASKSLWTDHEGLVLQQIGPDHMAEYQLHFWDEAIAEINPQQKTIRLIRLSPDTTPVTLEHLLYDQVYPRLFAHEGQLVLHAGAVEIGGKLALFLGDSGMGKSTLVASLYQAGAPLLNDDTLVVSQDAAGFSGQAIYHGLRLLPDSLASLFPGATETRQMAHYSPKQRLNVAVPNSQDTAAQPIGAMFFLAPATDQQTITLRPMSAAETCMGLISNSFSLDPTDLLLARKKLQQASALANGVAAFELSYPRDYTALPQVHATIRTQMTEYSASFPTSQQEETP